MGEGRKQSRQRGGCIIKELEGKTLTHAAKKKKGQKQALKVGNFGAIGTAELLDLFTIHVMSPK